MTKRQHDLLLEDTENHSQSTRSANLREARSGSFVDNMSLQVHRWYRFSAGFSAEWATTTIEQFSKGSTDFRVLDPFAGSGTTLIAADTSKACSFGIEAHSFLARIAEIKADWDQPTDELRSATTQWLKSAVGAEKLAPEEDAPLLHRCFSEKALIQLQALRNTLDYGSQEPPQIRNLRWLALTAALRPCSQVGTAQWQYILPNKTKHRIIDPYTAIRKIINIFCEDIDELRVLGYRPRGSVIHSDARQAHSYSGLAPIDLVLTSPPYPNNYDYADSTRLEMTFWGDVTTWSDLQDHVRKDLIRSCSQHSAAEKLCLSNLLSDSCITPIYEDLAEVTKELEKVRMSKGGRKTYHTMVAAYFCDLARVWKNLHDVTSDSATVCMVLGDCAPYGVYVPVDEWMGRLALAAGFRDWNFQKIRDRNIKWKNRKHRVKLKEGRLWVSKTRTS